jgi:drug/metabolite transporter (DMT)-like permease
MGLGAGMTKAQYLFALMIIFAYLGLNSLLNLMNRWALGLHGLRFPLFMTACHMIFGSCALSPLMFLSPKYADKHMDVLQNDWKGLVTIALMNGFQIACNNASLTVMELSMNQVIRASVPVCVAIFGVCIEHKVPSKAEVACLFVVSCGVMIAVWEESRNSTLGIILTVLSTVMQSIQMTVSGRLMSGKSGRLDSFQMTFYTGPVAFIALTPFAFAGEFNIMADALGREPMTVIGFLLGSCCVAVVYNVVLFQSVRTLSSVGTAILGNVKIVCLLGLSSILLGELGSWSANQYLGCLLTFLAAFSYSAVKQMQNRKPPAGPVVPKGDDVAMQAQQKLAEADVANAAESKSAK